MWKRSQHNQAIDELGHAWAAAESARLDQLHRLAAKRGWVHFAGSWVKPDQVRSLNRRLRWRGWVILVELGLLALGLSLTLSLMGLVAEKLIGKG